MAPAERCYDRARGQLEHTKLPLVCPLGIMGGP